MWEIWTLHSKINVTIDTIIAYYNMLDTAAPILLEGLLFS